MAIWLGEAGGIRLERAGGERMYATISPSEVDLPARRFGFDRPLSALITGDRVWFRRVEEDGTPSTQPLSFVAADAWLDGKQYPDGRWYVNVDGIGGIRLYHTWAAAIEGKKDKALPLATPPAAMRVSIETEADGRRCLAQTVGWTLNTNRETADVSSLGDGFRQQQGTMVSGSGTLDCLFDLKANEDHEASIYLHQLVIRQEIGARFTGVFLLKTKDGRPSTEELSLSDARRELFYACDCIITEVACELEVGATIHSRISFVTTGPIQLLFDLPRGYLLKENGGKVLQESGFGILLEVPED